MEYGRRNGNGIVKLIGGTLVGSVLMTSNLHSQEDQEELPLGVPADPTPYQGNQTQEVVPMQTQPLVSGNQMGYIVPGSMRIINDGEVECLNTRLAPGNEMYLATSITTNDRTDLIVGVEHKNKQMYNPNDRMLIVLERKKFYRGGDVRFEILDAAKNIVSRYDIHMKSRLMPREKWVYNKHDRLGDIGPDGLYTARVHFRGEHQGDIDFEVSKYIPSVQDLKNIKITF